MSQDDPQTTGNDEQGNPQGARPQDAAANPQEGSRTDRGVGGPALSAEDSPAAGEGDAGAEETDPHGRA